MNKCQEAARKLERVEELESVRKCQLKSGSGYDARDSVYCKSSHCKDAVANA